uniref:Uncharacterized protein n=1 Tax=Setaria italica TaxID=4555 RepID=K3ZG30_SETIT
MGKDIFFFTSWGRNTYHSALCAASLASHEQRAQHKGKRSNACCRCSSGSKEMKKWDEPAHARIMVSLQSHIICQ